MGWENMVAKNNSKNGSAYGLYFIFFVFMVVLVLWSTYPLWSYTFKDLFNNANSTEMGVFGDSYGALNTLFSAFAFTGIIASIYFQREELKLTRAELETTRDEIRNQSEQFELQTGAMHRQIFENTFYNLMNMVDLNLKRFSYNTSSIHGIVVVDGREAISTLVYENMRDITHVYKGNINDLDLDDRYDNAYDMLNNKCGDHIRTYIMSVYYTLILIDALKLDFDEKKFYSNIFRARMSNSELKLIFFVSLSIYGRHELKALIEKYEFFEHLDDESMSSFICDEMRAYFLLKFDRNAFGKTNSACLNYFKC